MERPPEGLREAAVSTDGTPGQVTRAFFERLASERQNSLLASLSGSVRFDLVRHGRVQHWFVALHDGTAEVSGRNDQADCVVTGDLSTFDAVAAGRLNVFTALLRGLLELRGKAILLVALQRVFPGPHDGDDLRNTGDARRR